MVMTVLDRFSGGNDPKGWILWAEQYFTCLGFSQKDWLPLPYFYLDGEALTWFTWLHRNKQFFDWKHFTEKLLMRFPQRTSSVSLVDTSRFYMDDVHNANFTPPATSTSPVVTLSHITNSSDLEDVVTNGNMEADHLLDILPEKYTNVNYLANLKGMGTLQIGNEISIEADLVQETSSINESQVFDECSPRDMSLRYVTATSPVRGSSKQKIEFEKFEEMHCVEFFLEPKTIEDLCLDNFSLEIGDIIPPSSMPLDDMMLVVEHENCTEELNAHNILCQFPFNPGATSLNVVVQETVVNFCVWDPGISFKSKSLTRSTMKVKPLLLLRSTIMFCSIAYANSVILVWDPGWQCRVHYLIFLCEFTWCMSLANRKGWQFLLVVYPYGSKFMNNDSDKPQVEALKLSCLISHIPTTNEVPPLEKHVSNPPHSKFLTSLLFGMLSKEYVFPSYHSLSSYQVVSSSTQITVFYTNTSPYYCSTLQFSHWDISDEKGPKRRVISVPLLQAKLSNFLLNFWIRTGKFIKMTYLSIILAETTQSFWSFFALVCYYLIIFSCFVTLQLCQVADGEHDICEQLCYVFLILPRLTKAFQHQHNFLVLWRCVTMWVEFIQLKGGSLVSYCAEILEVGNWFLVRPQPHRQHSMRLQLGNPLVKQLCRSFEVLKYLILPCKLKLFEAAQIYPLWCNSRLKHCTNQLNQQSMLLQNLEDKVLDSERSIVVNQTNYIRAYGLEVMDEAGPFKIIGLIKMLESFIWDPGPTINWLNRSLS